LADAEAGEELVEHILGVDAADNTAERIGGDPKLLCSELRWELGARMHVFQRGKARLDLPAVTELGDSRRVRAARRLTDDGAELGDQLRNASSRLRGKRMVGRDTRVDARRIDLVEDAQDALPALGDIRRNVR